MCVSAIVAMPRKTITILVVGAGGNFGKRVLSQLLRMQAHKECPMEIPTGKEADGAGMTLIIKAMSRKAKKGSDGVEWVVGDMMKPETLDKAMQGVDVVITSAAGYIKESIKTDFIGNRNLIDAAKRCGVKRYVLLSIATCDKADKVPHFHAKWEAEQHLRASGVPFVAIRAPSFLDQEDDYIANDVPKGKMTMLGDSSKSKWSWVYSWDLALACAKACVHPTDDINNQAIDAGWEDGPKTQGEIAKCLGTILGKEIKPFIMPWWLLNVIFGIGGCFSSSMADNKAMFAFMRSGVFVSDLTAYHKFFGPSPTMEDALRRWAKEKKLLRTE